MHPCMQARPTSLSFSTICCIVCLLCFGNSDTRKTHPSNASILSTVPVGAEIKVIEKTTDWTKTEIDGVTGYISTWFLKF